MYVPNVLATQFYGSIPVGPEQPLLKAVAQLFRPASRWSTPI